MTKWRKVWCDLIVVCSFGGIIIFFDSCQSNGQLKNYYFPVDQLHDGRVYHFKPLEDSLLSDQFWFLQSSQTEKGYVLDGQIYDESGTLTHSWSEEINQSGSVMIEYRFAEKDSVSGQYTYSETNIMQDDIFPFDADPGGIFLFDMTWKDNKVSGQSFQLIRNRIFQSDTVVSWHDEKKKAIRFNLKERLEVNQEGILGIDMTGQEIYLNGLGLYSYTKKIGNESARTYILDDIFNMAEFKTKFAFDLITIDE